jgi:predicted NBD/HSP70 family sugar kinase
MITVTTPQSATPQPATPHPATRPTLGLLRSLTDEHVLRLLLDHRQLTRSELAALSGISKPTVAQSVQRLTEARLVRDTGERTTGRGRAGSYFALAEDLGQALAIAITAAAVEVQRVDPRGEVRAHARRPIPQSPTGGVERALLDAAAAATAGHERARLAVVSAADPVDRRTGRLVELPDSPFVVGSLDPTGVLATQVDGPVSVDNDVNWSARAELAQPGAPSDFGLIYLGDGLGCSLVSDGDVRRGRHGLSGEISHVVTIGPDHRATTFTDVFARLGLHRPGTHAIDSPRLAALMSDDTSPGARQIRDTVADAICGVLVTIVSLADPEVIIIGGPWGGLPNLIDIIADRMADQPRSVEVRLSRLPGDAPLAAARGQAVADLQRALLASRACEA